MIIGSGIMKREYEAALSAPINTFTNATTTIEEVLMNVLDQLGMSLYARSNFMARHMPSFAAHRNIAYRFLPPGKIVAAFDISITAPPPCYFTRLFLIFRGLTDEEMGLFDGAGEKEANQANWREVTAWNEDAKDNTIFRVLETSVLEVT